MSSALAAVTRLPFGLSAYPLRLLRPLRLLHPLCPAMSSAAVASAVSLSWGRSLAVDDVLLLVNASLLNVTKNSTCKTDSSALGTTPLLGCYDFLVALGACSVSGSCSILGMIFMKSGAAQIDRMPAEKRLNVPWLVKDGLLFRVFPTKLAWAWGFTLLVIIPLPTDIVSLSFGSQSIIFPLMTAVTVIVGQLVAPACFFKTERLNAREWFGTFLIVFGAILTSVFGAQENKSYTVEIILLLYQKTLFLVTLGVTTALFIVAVYITHNSHKHKSLPAVLGMMSVAYVPSFLCGVQTICFKSMSELTANAAEGTSNEWDGPYPWIFLAFIVLCAIFQMVYINIGSAKYQATRYFPVYNATLMVCTCLFGIVFYEEYLQWGATWWAFPLGVIIIIVGIALLSWSDPTDQVHVAAEIVRINSQKMLVSGGASVAPVGEEAGKGGHARGVGKFERNGVAVSFGATSPRADVPDEGTAVEASSTPASAGEGLQGAHTYRVSMQGHPESLPYPEDESCVAAVLSRGDLLAGPAY